MSAVDEMRRDLLAMQLAMLRMNTMVAAGSKRAVTKHTGMLEASVKRHASQPRTRLRPNVGAPEGPRLLTGGYLGGMHRTVVTTTWGASGFVGSPDPRSGPLELGAHNLFGRGIRMQPYPHFGPAADEIEPLFVSAMAAVVELAIVSTRGRPGGSPA